MAHLKPFLQAITKLATVLLLATACLRAQTPTDTEGAAKLLTFTGQISVVRSDYAWALHVGDAVKPQEVVVTGTDGWGLFQVADGSKFEVYPNSKVVFRANRGDWRDLLEIWLGKVRVQIEHFGGLPNNNKVRTPTAVISVRGTIFIIEVEAETHTTLVQDEEGIVVVQHVLKPSQTILKQGEYVRVFENEPLGKAIFDRGGTMQRMAKALQDAFYQIAANGHGTTVGRGAAGAASTGVGSPADQNKGSASGTATGTSSGGTTTAPPPPAPAPPPPH